MSNKERKKLSHKKEIYNMINNFNTTSLEIEGNDVIMNDVIYELDDHDAGDYYETRHFFKALRTNKRIEILTIYYFDEYQAVQLSKTLMKNNTIRELNLIDCCLELNKIKYLSNALKINKAIIDLDLQWNDITNEGIKYLSDALIVNETIVKIGLESNKITDKGGEFLIELLKKNNKIYDIDLIGNPISAQIVTQIKQCLDKNRMKHDIEKIHQDVIENRIVGEFKKLCEDNDETEALKMINMHGTKCYPAKALIMANNNDAVYWILKNKMRKMAKELIIKCDVMKRLYERGDNLVNLIENDI